MSKLIAIGGGSGSGKSTLARALMAHYPDEIAILSYDWYYRDRKGESEEEKARANYDEPKAIDAKLFLEHAKKLKSGESIEAPVYDFATHERQKETHRVEPKPFVIVDGVLHVIDGPLVGQEERISKVDRHRRRCTVRVADGDGGFAEQAARIDLAAMEAGRL